MAGGDVTMYGSPSRASTPGRRSMAPPAPKPARRWPDGSMATRRPSQVPEKIVEPVPSGCGHTATPRWGDSHLRARPASGSTRQRSAPVSASSAMTLLCVVVTRSRSPSRTGRVCSPSTARPGLGPRPPANSPVRAVQSTRNADTLAGVMSVSAENRADGWGRVGTGSVGLGRVGTGWGRSRSAAHTPATMSAPRIECPTSR